MRISEASQLPVTGYQVSGVRLAAEWSEWEQRHERVGAGLALVKRVGARERRQRASFKGQKMVKSWQDVARTRVKRAILKL